MTDLAVGIEERNYGIKRRTDSRNLFDLLCIVLSIAAMAGVVFFYIWVRIQTVNVGYESQQLQASADALLRAGKNLALEEQTLKDPGRIDMIARVQLGMVPLRPHQIVTIGVRSEQPGAPVALALVGPRPSNGSGKSPANN